MATASASDVNKMATASASDVDFRPFREKSIIKILNESKKKIGVKLKSCMMIIRIIVKNTGIDTIHYLITNLTSVASAPR